jgi:hypothetical protein
MKILAYAVFRNPVKNKSVQGVFKKSPKKQAKEKEAPSVPPWKLVANTPKYHRQKNHKRCGWVNFC